VQLELRIMAALSRDPAMLDLLASVRQNIAFSFVFLLY
jgi:hypothetical protein